MALRAAAAVVAGVVGAVLALVVVVLIEGPECYEENCPALGVLSPEATWIVIGSVGLAAGAAVFLAFRPQR